MEEHRDRQRRQSPILVVMKPQECKIKVPAALKMLLVPTQQVGPCGQSRAGDGQGLTLDLVSASGQMSSASPPHSAGLASCLHPLCALGMESCPAGGQGCRALEQDRGGINTIQPKVPVPEQHLVSAISSHQLPPEKKMNVSWGARAPDLQEPVAGAACSYRKEI